MSLLDTLPPTTSFLDLETTLDSPESISPNEPGRDNDFNLLLDEVFQRAEHLGIPDDVLRPTFVVIGRLRELDVLYDLEMATEALEVQTIALDAGAAGDRAMGVYTNEAAIIAAAGTHDGGKSRIDSGVLIRSQHGGFTPQDLAAIKEHVRYSADIVREEGMPLIPVQLSPNGMTEDVDIAKVVHASHDKQIKGSYLVGPQLEWGERRVRDYVTIADQALAMLFRDTDYNKHMTLDERWAWIEEAVTYVFDDYWYPSHVTAAVIDGLKNNELIQAKAMRKFQIPVSAGNLALSAA